MNRTTHVNSSLRRCLAECHDVAVSRVVAGSPDRCCGRVSRPVLWQGLTTLTRSSTEGLPVGDAALLETFGRPGGTVGRPCRNAGSPDLLCLSNPLERKWFREFF